MSDIFENVLIDVLKTQTGKSHEELQELLYEKPDGSDEFALKTNAKDLILELDANRVETIRTNKDKEWEQKAEKIKKDQSGKGKKEALEELEKSLIDEFKIDAKDKKGVDLVREIIKANTKITLSADEIKKHPAFLELESKINTDYVPKAELDELKRLHESEKQAIERDKTVKKLRELALGTMREMKLKMPENVSIRERQEDAFLKLYVDNLKVDFASENPILLNDDGTRREDKHGNAIPLSNYIISLVPTMFEVLVQDPNGGPGNKTPQGGSSGSLKEPETLDEFNETRAKLHGKELIDYFDKWQSKFNKK